MSQPTSDPATWVPIPPNTVMAAAAALQAVADRYEVNGWHNDADACHELSARLTRHLMQWAERGGYPVPGD
jgi:hypothetical protein